MREILVGTINGQAIRKIASPRQHDVLCGRGGGINSHKGNRIFRDWVAERRTEYNLANCKLEKVRIAKEVMDLVKNQQPPGRFLVRDDSEGIGSWWLAIGGSWWVEINDAKAMAKTSQALREGAPSIRAERKQRSRKSFSYTAVTTSSSSSSGLPPALTTNKQFESTYTFKSWCMTHESIMPEKHTSAVPSLIPASPVPSDSSIDSGGDETEPLASIKSELNRRVLEGLMNDFVNPFVNDDVNKDKFWETLNEMAAV
jgi:hypothetical protein